jgi:CsoR family transcriptional regulator, copper-sensing transcriptional repressor
MLRIHPTRGGVLQEGAFVQELAQRDALNRLKTVRGHLDGIIRMVEQDAYCVDLMKQVSAAQSSLEKVNRLILRNHLETCFSEAVNEGRGHAAIAELMDAVKFDKVFTGGEASLAGAATGEVANA